MPGTGSGSGSGSGSARRAAFRENAAPNRPAHGSGSNQNESPERYKTAGFPTFLGRCHGPSPARRRDMVHRNQTSPGKQSLLRDTKGATAVEYALMLVAILLIVAGAFKSLGQAVGTKAESAASQLK